MKMYAIFTHNGTYEDYRTELQFVTKRKWVADDWIKRYNNLLPKLKTHKLDMSHNENISEHDRITLYSKWNELMYTFEVYIEEVEKR